MIPPWERQNLRALSTPSRWSRSWNSGRKLSRLVRAFMLRSHRQTTRAAATRESSSIGRKKYHSWVIKRISALIAWPSAVGDGLPNRLAKPGRRFKKGLGKVGGAGRG